MSFQVSVTSANNKFETKKTVERSHRSDMVSRELDHYSRTVWKKPNQLLISVGEKNDPAEIWFIDCQQQKKTDGL